MQLYFTITLKKRKVIDYFFNFWMFLFYKFYEFNEIYHDSFMLITIVIILLLNTKVVDYFYFICNRD